MIGTTPEFKRCSQTDHASECQLDLLVDGKKTGELDIYDGTINIDATAAAVRNATFSFGDPDGLLSPRNMSDPLAPFGAAELQAWRGIRKPKITRIVALSNTQASWATGNHAGTKADPTLGLVLAD